jgi:hypothetical protein
VEWPDRKHKRKDSKQGKGIGDRLSAIQDGGHAMASGSTGLGRPILLLLPACVLPLAQLVTVRMRWVTGEIGDAAMLMCPK